VTAVLWRRMGILALMLGGLIALVVVGQAVNRWQPRQAARAGWQIIRPPYEVSALAEQGEIVWAGGMDGVFALDRNTGALVRELDLGRPLEGVRALLVDQAGALWIGHQAGLTRYNGTTWHNYTSDDGLPDDRVNALLVNDVDSLWVGTWGGAAVADRVGDGHVWRVLGEKDGLAEDMVNVMLQDSQGSMWFGSYVAPRGGISRLQDGTWQHFTTVDGLPHNNVTALLEDDTGSVWAGTGLIDRGGACRLERTETGWIIAQVLTQQDGLAGAKVRSIFQDDDGALWFGSEYDGLARYDGRSWRLFTQRDGLAADEVKVILQDVDGDLWFGTTDGVTRIRASALAALRAETNVN
jgi:ligand-binding sensor domain-containing protein